MNVALTNTDSRAGGTAHRWQAGSKARFFIENKQVQTNRAEDSTKNDLKTGLKYKLK